LRVTSLIQFQSLERNEGTLKQLMEQNAELETDVERVRQRDELLAKVFRGSHMCQTLCHLLFFISVMLSSSFLSFSSGFMILVI